jgi:preprotein translocase subunit SecD
LILSSIILYPNFSERELELHINPTVQSLSKEEKSALLARFKEKWTNDYNSKLSWKISPEITDSLPTENYFLVTGRFITSAKINQISQENLQLFTESKNKLRPTKIEDLVKGGKPLTIKLGLDLQGGMRVVMKGDFETYVTKLKDIYSKDISDLKETLANPNKPKEEKDKASARLKEIEDNFILTENRKLIELEKAKLIIDNRLTNQNLTEPQVRIQKDQDSIEVALPGVANSSQILEILQNTETVEYRLEEPIGAGSFTSLIEASEQELMRANKREETEIFQFQKIVKERLGKKAREEFLSKMEEKYKIPTDKYKIFPFFARGNRPDSPLLPRSFVVLEKSIALSGNDLSDAKSSFNPNNYGWNVSFTLTPAGTNKFFEITKNNKGRRLAIIWGDQVISNPTINDPIAGGRAEITGSFTQEESIQLSNIISEGALPIPLSILEMRFIGPTLGIESIEVGLRSVIIGFILVMVYMILYYKLAGLVADIALLCNLVILMGLLSLMDFTLTLPGFAGIILTVGMAVDANVIIFERIKEELSSKKSLPLAITQGFENAFWTIFDSNITTLISGILMIRLGNGPIKGFAITLCWGIITSLFTSLLLSRLILNFLVNKVGVRKLRLGFTSNEVKNV